MVLSKSPKTVKSVQAKDILPQSCVLNLDKRDRKCPSPAKVGGWYTSHMLPLLYHLRCRGFTNAW